MSEFVRKVQSATESCPLSFILFLEVAMSLLKKKSECFDVLVIM